MTVKNVDGNLTTISFNVKAPNRREVYEFSVKSKSENGAFTKLDTAPAEDDVQPSVAVGNIAAGKGMAVIRLDDADTAYEGDTGVDFEFTLTAAGPMYSIEGGQQAKVAIEFPFPVNAGNQNAGVPAALGGALGTGSFEVNNTVIITIDALDEGETLVAGCNNYHPKRYSG